MKVPVIEGVSLEPLDAHVDERGSFTELLRLADYPHKFAQVNHSRSAEGVLRGLHFHRKQADLWYVPRGCIQVGLVDLRERKEAPSSETLYLSAETPQRLFIPPGVAHGYLALEPSDLVYLVTNTYDSTDEYGLAWDDATASLAWDLGSGSPILSERDQNNPILAWEGIPSF